MNRKGARESLMQLFYQMDITSDFSDGQKDIFYSGYPSWVKQENYINTCFNVFLRQKAEIDEKIDLASPKWSLKQFPRVDLAVLRLAVTEMLFTDVPMAISVNEALNMSEKFSSPENKSFINGILGTISKEGKIKAPISVEK